MEPEISTFKSLHYADNIDSDSLYSSFEEHVDAYVPVDPGMELTTEEAAHLCAIMDPEEYPDYVPDPIMVDRIMAKVERGGAAFSSRDARYARDHDECAEIRAKQNQREDVPVEAVWAIIQAQEGCTATSAYDLDRGFNSVSAGKCGKVEFLSERERNRMNGIINVNEVNNTDNVNTGIEFTLANAIDMAYILAKSWFTGEEPRVQEVNCVPDPIVLTLGGQPTNVADIIINTCDEHNNILDAPEKRQHRHREERKHKKHKKHRRHRTEKVVNNNDVKPEDDSDLPPIVKLNFNMDDIFNESGTEIVEQKTVVTDPVTNPVANPVTNQATKPKPIVINEEPAKRKEKKKSNSTCIVS